MTLQIAHATESDVRMIARRRKFDEAAFRVALELGDRGTIWAARDDGEVIGVAIAHASDFERFVGDLYVEPSFRGQGIAERLLEAAFADAEDVQRTMLIDPADPAGLALAVRCGLRPTDAVVRIAGAVLREEELAKMAAGDYRFEVEPLDLAVHEYAVSALDREARGTTHMADHRYFARYAFGQMFAVDGEPIAYAYVWPDGHIGPIAAASAGYVVQIFAYTLVTLRRRHQGSWCTLLVPAANIRIARAALRSRLRIERTLLLASDGAIVDGSTYVGYQPLLY